MLTLTVAELAEAEERDLGATSWTSVDQARINAFADVTGDHQWIHVDVERAGQSPAGGTIAHGYFTLSLVSSFLLELIEVTDASSAVNYGLDRVRFPAALPVDSDVRASGNLVSVEDVGAALHARVAITIERRGGDRPVAVADVIVRYVR